MDGAVPSLVYLVQGPLPVVRPERAAAVAYGTRKVELVMYVCGACRTEVESDNHICYKADPNRPIRTPISDRGRVLAATLALERMERIEKVLQQCYNRCTTDWSSPTPESLRDARTDAEQCRLQLERLKEGK